MKNFMEFYKNMENPIDNKEIIEKLLIANSKSSNGNLYNKLVFLSEKKPSKTCNKRHEDRYYALIFKEWKESILKLTREDIFDLRQRGKADSDLLELQNVLKNVPDFKKKKDIMEFIGEKKNPNTTERLIEKYSWESFGKYSDWNHMNSQYINLSKENDQEIEHRLYLNINPEDVYAVLYHLTKKCNEKNLQFYYKFDPTSTRDENIVIYSSTENLMKYYNILNEIKNENKELIKRANRPTALSGVIDNWIGYGSEPLKENIFSERSSFNAKRSEALENVFNEVITEWYKEHKNDIINNSNNTMKQLITHRFVEHIYKDVNKKSSKPKKLFKNILEASYIGSKIQEKLENNKRKNTFKDIIKYLDNNNINFKNPMDGMKCYIDDKYCYIESSTVQMILKQIITDLALNDENFIPYVQHCIKQDALKRGIDPEKYCFDIKNKEHLINYERQIKQNNNASSTQTQRIKTTNNVETLKPTNNIETLKPTTEIDTILPEKEMTENTVRATLTIKQPKPIKKPILSQNTQIMNKPVTNTANNNIESQTAQVRAAASSGNNVPPIYTINAYNNLNEPPENGNFTLNGKMTKNEPEPINKIKTDSIYNDNKFIMNNKIILNEIILDVASPKMQEIQIKKELKKYYPTYTDNQINELFNNCKVEIIGYNLNEDYMCEDGNSITRARLVLKEDNNKNSIKKLEEQLINKYPNHSNLVKETIANCIINEMSSNQSNDIHKSLKK